MSRGTVILVFPKVVPERPGSAVWTLLPLSLLSIATPIIEAGLEVRLIDQRVDASWRGTLTDALDATDVVCVGVSAMSGLPIDGALSASSLVKQLRPDVPVVWGGVHASLLPEQTLASPVVDYVVVGEGERAFPSLVEALAGDLDPLEVPGVFALRDGHLAGTPESDLMKMDTLSRPAYELVDIDNYLNAPFMTTQRPLAFITSRGCPGRCRYCYNLAFNHHRWRGMSPERVISDIRRLIADFSVDSVFLLDDNFFANWPRAMEICNSIIGEQLDITFLNANCRVSTLKDRTAQELELLCRAGFQKLFIGVESGSDEVLGMMAKDTDVEQILRVNLALRSAGVVPVYSFMIGLPGESVSQMKATLRLMLELVEAYPEAVVNAVNIYSPFPGTPLYDEAVRSGMPEPACLEAWKDLDYVCVNYRAGFTPGQIKFMERASYLSSLIDPKRDSGAPGLRNAARRGYASLTRWRVRRGFYSMMPEATALSRRRLAWGQEADA